MHTPSGRLFFGKGSRFMLIGDLLRIRHTGGEELSTLQSTPMQAQHRPQLSPASQNQPGFAGGSRKRESSLSAEDLGEKRVWKLTPIRLTPVTVIYSLLRLRAPIMQFSFYKIVIGSLRTTFTSLLCHTIFEQSQRNWCAASIVHIRRARQI